MQVKATLTRKDGNSAVVHVDWNNRREVGSFAELADECLRAGGKVLTEKED